ncbi:hypothetical protein Tsubulata_014997 [Turnera subulata]|uniref:Bifunctional inhibitor/plant lipid transfer protein/seed storage helical domain-containing protein n=1 Tax=Turnera subulata TaxID=218843 RepID=A0A9Q0F4H0_9ROSI|nr:hypothetical protein Tsubulata_014997 [Turnera subulata]
MGSKNITSQGIPCILVTLVLLLPGFAVADFQQDRAECADQLVGLATCLPYVGGESKAPTLDCCSGLKQVLDKSMKCLCILIKDRNDPNLGLKINVTLAATLPSSCHSPVNVSDCTGLLHLPPNSPDAKVFAGFANITKVNATAPVTSGNSSSRQSSANEKSGGERANGWIAAEMICGLLLLWVLTCFHL